MIHPDPVSSGGAQWSVLAIYGSELVKSEKQSGEPDQARALQTLRAIWHNVISTPGSAREARTQFETGFGDALITYELEGLLMKQAGNAGRDRRSEGDDFQRTSGGSGRPKCISS